MRNLPPLPPGKPRIPYPDGNGYFRDHDWKTFSGSCFILTNVQEPVLQTNGCHLQIIIGLKMHPVLRNLPKGLADKVSHFGNNRSVSVNNVGYPHAGNTKTVEKFILGYLPFPLESQKETLQDE